METREIRSSVEGGAAMRDEVTDTSELTEFDMDFRGALVASSETQFSAVSHKISFSRKSIDSLDEKVQLEQKITEEPEHDPIQEASEEDMPPRREMENANHSQVQPDEINNQAQAEEESQSQVLKGEPQAYSEPETPMESVTDLETVRMGMFKGYALDLTEYQSASVRSSLQSGTALTSPQVKQEENVAASAKSEKEEKQEEKVEEYSDNFKEEEEQGTKNKPELNDQEAEKQPNEDQEKPESQKEDQQEEKKKEEIIEKPLQKEESQGEKEAEDYEEVEFEKQSPKKEEKQVEEMPLKEDSIPPEQAELNPRDSLEDPKESEELPDSLEGESKEELGEEKKEERAEEENYSDQEEEFVNEEEVNEETNQVTTSQKENEEKKESDEENYDQEFDGESPVKMEKEAAEEEQIENADSLEADSLGEKKQQQQEEEDSPYGEEMEEDVYTPRSEQKEETEEARGSIEKPQESEISKEESPNQTKEAAEKEVKNLEQEDIFDEEEKEAQKYEDQEEPMDEEDEATPPVSGRKERREEEIMENKEAEQQERVQELTLSKDTMNANQGHKLKEEEENVKTKVSASNILRLREEQAEEQKGESTIAASKSEFEDNFVAILANDLIEERHGGRDLHKVAEPFVSPPSGVAPQKPMSRSSSGSSINSDKNAPTGGEVQTYELKQRLMGSEQKSAQKRITKQKSEEESEMTLRLLQPRYPIQKGRRMDGSKAVKSQLQARPPPPVQIKSRRAKTKFIRGGVSPFEDKMSPTPRDLSEKPTSVPQRILPKNKARSPIQHGVYYPGPLQTSAPPKKKRLSQFNKTVFGFRPQNTMAQFERIQRTYLNPPTRERQGERYGSEAILPQVFSKGTELKSNLINADRTFQYISQYDSNFTQDVESLGSEGTFTSNDPKWQRVMSYIRKNPQVLMRLIPSPLSGEDMKGGPKGGGSFSYYKREKPIQHNQWMNATPARRGKESPVSDQLRLPSVLDPSNNRNIMVQNETERGMSQQSDFRSYHDPNFPPVESFRANYEKLYEDTTSSMENASKQAVRQTDWAETPLFENFTQGQLLFNAQGDYIIIREKDLSYYNEMDIEYILEMLKQKYKDFKKSELLKPFFKKASTTLKKVMEEFSMQQQFQTVQMKHAEIKIENTLRYLIRARLLLQARSKLIQIFALIYKREELSRNLRDALEGKGNIDVRESSDWPAIEKLNRNLKHVTSMAMKMITQFQGEFKQFKGNFVFRQADYFKIMRDDVVDIQNQLRKISEN